MNNESDCYYYNSIIIVNLCVRKANSSKETFLILQGMDSVSVFWNSENLTKTLGWYPPSKLMLWGPVLSVLMFWQGVNIFLPNDTSPIIGKIPSWCLSKASAVLWMLLQYQSWNNKNKTTITFCYHLDTCVVCGTFIRNYNTLTRVVKLVLNMKTMQKDISIFTYLLLWWPRRAKSENLLSMFTLL